MDYYFSFFTGKKRQRISGPFAIKSVIGWILGASYRSPPGDNAATNSCVTVVKCCTTSTVLNEDPVRKNLQKFCRSVKHFYSIYIPTSLYNSLVSLFQYSPIRYFNLIQYKF